MAEPYPHSKEMGDMGSPPSPRPAASGAPRGDEGQGDGVAAEHPKGRSAPLPPGHPSAETIDEGGEHGSG